jgi:tRNA pseudouridine55 synthase
MNFAEGEILLINKPLNWTSFDVVNKLRYALTKKIGHKLKVGHAGTLDPLATGLLLICTGKMTKQIEGYTGMDKEYTGTFFIGATTDTYDSEMEPNATYPVSHITETLIYETTKHFTGTLQQLPPVYSAIKIDGKAAYINARKGKDVEMKSREVIIHEFELTRIALPEVDFRVVCSKGTYIRSLAHDFGRSLASGAYLKSLCRTRIGEFELKDSLTIEDALKIITG